MNPPIAVTDPATGEVTLYLADVSGGPVITGQNLAEAQTKFREAWGLCLVADLFNYPASVERAEAAERQYKVLAFA